jgi:hypothetical protein
MKSYRETVRPKRFFLKKIKTAKLFVFISHTKGENTMLRKHSIMISLIFLTFLFIGCSSKDPDRYYNTKDDFSIEFPKEWENKENFMRCAVISLSPKENDADQFRENVNVAVEQLPGEMTLHDYMEKSIPNIAKVITDFQVNEKGTTTINDHEVQWLMYSGRMGTINLKCKQYYMIQNKRGYVITYSAAPDSYARTISTFEKIAHSFEFE